MLIDAHQHFWSLARGDYDWLTPDLPALYRNFLPADLQPMLSDHLIDGTVAVQAAPTIAETEYLLALADINPWIMGVVGWVDFEAGNAVAQIERLARHPRLVGLRPMLQDIARHDWILDAALAAPLGAMIDAGLIFDALIRPVHLSSVDVLAARYPALTIVVDHAAKPAIGEPTRFDDWLAGITALGRHANVHCKLSGLMTEAPANADRAMLQPYVDALIASFGPRRLLWGSDWPVVLLAGDYARWLSITGDLLAGAALDHASIAAIRGGNACRIYKLTNEDDAV
jgi:L-fuconolactonase